MLRSIFFVALAFASLACGPGETSSGSTGGDGGGGAGATFTPLASSFSGYHGWQSFHLEHGTQADGVHDVNAPLTAFLNKKPPSGATSFPVGTIIVKEVEQGSIGSRQVFAIVKVGGGYNADGAVDWEWFELGRATDGSDTARIIWSGTKPPPGDKYSGGVKGDCNGCHIGARSNDYIWSAPLDLKTLDK